MASIAQNSAAWQIVVFDKEFTVKDRPDQKHPADDEVVIKVAFVAINPSEWKLDLEYPHVLGSDAAGEVVTTGSKVTRFKPGDRVIDYCLELIYGASKHGTFQRFTTCRGRVVAKLPDNMLLSQGVVLPLAVYTSIVGLFEHLQLRLPSLTPQASGEMVLIWGASSSADSVAIQLARAAGYEVVTTAGRRNHEYAKRMCAAEVFDYADENVVQKVQQYLAGRQLAGVYDCIGGEYTTRTCAEFVAGFGGGILPTVLWPPKDLLQIVKPEMVWSFGPSTVDGYLASAIWADFVPNALRTRILQAQPEAQILKGGLSKLQEALELQKKGVPAKKIVVTIDDSMGE